MADTAGEEQNTDPEARSGVLSAPIKIASFVVLPVLAAGSLLLGQEDPPDFVPRPSRSIVPEAAHHPMSPATTAARHMVTKTPWQEALESGGGYQCGWIPPRCPRSLERPTTARPHVSRSAPGCHLDWALLAAIGQIESDHGRHGGSSLRPDGTTSVPIRGVPLNGDGVALIHDTDGGALDGDVVFDRAMGPMQFLPGTWRSVGEDGNADGHTAPDNIFDAAVAAGRYLCDGGGDLVVPAEAAAAVYRYNQSGSYVTAVLGLAERLRTTPPG